jgi:hypothetical protein
MFKERFFHNVVFTRIWRKTLTSEHSKPVISLVLGETTVGIFQL